ncbi:MAG TPA: hypothetical protein DCQ06_09115 [Myxococcales bacterium]|nr:hypothetical protein [Myxococcales bacterium]
MERLCRRLHFYVDNRPRWMVPSERATELASELDSVLDKIEQQAAQIDGFDASIPLQVGRQRLEQWRTLISEPQTHSDDHVQLVNLLKDVRWVLHRYARHFSGQRRATRDISRLVASRLRLVEITRQATLLKHEGTAPVLLGEIQALPRFVEFLVQEQGEISDMVRRMGRFEQAQALTIVCQELCDTWRLLCEPQPALRSVAWMERTLGSTQEIFERMNAIRHANLPQQYEDMIVDIGERLTQWPDELALSRAAGISLSQAQRLLLLQERSAQLLDWVEEQLLIEPDASSLARSLWAQRCDEFDQLLSIVDSHPNLDGFDQRDALVDALLWCGSQFDNA